MVPGISDHSPSVVSIFEGRFHAPPPYKFCSFWTKEPDFLDIVRQAWKEPIQGNPMMVLVGKLKRLMKILILWKQERFKKFSEQVICARDNMHSIQQQLQKFPLNSSIAQVEKVAVKTYAKLAKYDESISKEKSEMMEVGDSNTRFFYSSLRERRSRNNILILNSRDNVKLEDDKAIAAECIDFFDSIFTKETSSDASEAFIELLNIDKMVSVDDVVDLVKPVIRDEIVVALSSIHSTKSPGPDGFNSYFFKFSWSIVGDDFVAAVQNFFKSGKMLKEINCTFITLLAKCDNPSTIGYFRPISCCNVIYKCISKIIASKMKFVLKGLISSNQSAFISGRSIQDNILLAHEIVRNYHKTSGTPRCSLKIDLQKAYDIVSWDPIRAVMKKLGFPHQFIDWIYSCISTSRFSVMVNGSPFGFFGAKRGIRQGCPISPYIFVMVMEVFSALLKQQGSSGSFGLHPKCKTTQLTHLCFANDVLVFFKGTVKASQVLAGVIEEFSQFSGLEINCKKTSLFSSAVDEVTLSSIMECLSCSKGVLPVRS